jgi:hypothetical protein
MQATGDIGDLGDRVKDTPMLFLEFLFTVSCKYSNNIFFIFVPMVSK